ncbi:MAG: hypothetical protein J2P45_27510, partial [Candidatus Dormibacteraeota bacterium]|nr:hypothetical protein [Candidatus Dormibacteraeota bacterium]
QVQMAVGGPGAGPTQPFAHPLLFVNPFTAMTALLQPSPVAGPVYLGRAVQIMMLGSGPASTSGPLVEAWQASILIELLLVVLSVFGAIQALRGPRALPWLTRSHSRNPTQRAEPPPNADQPNSQGGHQPRQSPPATLGEEGVGSRYDGHTEFHDQAHAASGDQIGPGA